MPAAGAQRLVLHDVHELQAELLAAAELLGERLGHVGGAEHDPAHARGADAGEQVGQERHPGGGQHRLGGRERQRPQPRALAPDQHHGLDVVQHAHVLSHRA
jgi:hypothetical protein